MKKCVLISVALLFAQTASCNQQLKTSIAPEYQPHLAQKGIAKKTTISNLKKVVAVVVLAACGYGFYKVYGPQTAGGLPSKLPKRHNPETLPPSPDAIPDQPQNLGNKQVDPLINPPAENQSNQQEPHLAPEDAQQKADSISLVQNELVALVNHIAQNMTGEKDRDFALLNKKLIVESIIGTGGKKIFKVVPTTDDDAYKDYLENLETYFTVYDCTDADKEKLVKALYSHLARLIQRRNKETNSRLAIKLESGTICFGKTVIDFLEAFCKPSTGHNSWKHFLPQQRS